MSEWPSCYNSVHLPTDAGCAICIVIIDQRKISACCTSIHIECAMTISGGSAGIGRATALQFDANGAIVTVMGRRLERLEAVVKQMKHGHAVVGDLSEAGDMARVVQEAIEKMGGLDVLVNNGGASNDAMVGETEEAYLAAMKLHVTGVLLCLHACSFQGRTPFHHRKFWVLCYSIINHTCLWNRQHGAHPRR